MKLNLNEPFTLEIQNGDDEQVIKGYLKKVTKKQEAEIKAKFKKEYKTIEEMGDLAKKAQREKLRADLGGDETEAKKSGAEMLEKLYLLQDSIDENDFKEKIAKYRFDLSVESPQMIELIEIAENFGYEFLLEMINKDVAEKKGNDIPA